MAKRKRQHLQSKKEEGHEDNHDEEERDDEESQDEQSAPPAPTAGRSGGRHGRRKATVEEKETKKEKETQKDEKVWVQCNDCDKWRSLPSFVNPDSLPDIWVCKFNTYDNVYNTCEANEESYKEEEVQDLQLKAFIRLWLKKMRNADRAETRFTSSTITRGNKKKKPEIEWIQCSNPTCGKWRSLTRGIESRALLKKMNKNKPLQSKYVWYCSMNSWDDTIASCSAPQESLWNTSWNLENYDKDFLWNLNPATLNSSNSNPSASGNPSSSSLSTTDSANNTNSLSV